MMFKVWLINFGHWATGSYDTFYEAVERAVECGYEASIQEFTGVRFVDVGSWSPITGLKRHADVVSGGSLS
jgi:hypothetical protein